MYMCMYIIIIIIGYVVNSGMQTNPLTTTALLQGQTLTQNNRHTHSYLLNVPNPVSNVVKRLLVCDIIDEHDSLKERDMH